MDFDQTCIGTLLGGGEELIRFKRIVGKSDFSDQFKKIVKRYIRVGYNLDIM